MLPPASHLVELLMDPMQRQNQFSSSSAYSPQQQMPVTHTQQPIVTGTSVLGIQYKDGVMLVADTLGSYGSLARFRDERRLFQVGAQTVVGAGGDISDYQYLQHLLNELVVDDYEWDDGHQLGPEHVYSYLSQVMYQRRSKMDPFWNNLVVAGVRHDKKFLGVVDLRGTTWQSTTVATGFGGYLAQPLLRKQVEGREHELSEQEAIKILDDCMRVLFYRDARSLNRFQRAKITKHGIEITQPYAVNTEWSFAENIRGYGV